MTAKDALTTARVVAWPTPLRAAGGLQAGLAGDQRDGAAVGRRLEQARDQVLPADQSHGQEGKWVDSEAKPAGEHAGDLSDQHPVDGQADHHRRCGLEARHDEVVNRIGVAHAQGIHLLGHHHGADLGGDARADPGRHHHAGDGGRELLDHDLQESRAEHGEVRQDALDLGRHLIDQDHAQKTQGHGDEDQRAVADGVHLLGHRARTASTE